MTIEPTPSATGLPVSQESRTAKNAITSPATAPASSSRTTGMVGSLLWKSACQSGRFPRIWLNSRIATVKLPTSSPMDTTSTISGRNRRHRFPVAAAQSAHAFVDGEHAAQEEQRERHHERPEVTLLLAPERVKARRLARRERHAEQEQGLVCRVRDRVHALGHHRRAAREPGRDELRHRDPGVRHERRDHDLLGIRAQVQGAPI